MKNRGHSPRFADSVLVLELMFDLSAESCLKLFSFVNTQAGVRCSSDCQCEVVHLSSPFCVVRLTERSLALPELLSIQQFRIFDTGYFYRCSFFPFEPEFSGPTETRVVLKRSSIDEPFSLEVDAFLHSSAWPTTLAMISDHDICLPTEMTAALRADRDCCQLRAHRHLRIRLRSQYLCDAVSYT